MGGRAPSPPACGTQVSGCTPGHPDIWGDPPRTLPTKKEHKDPKISLSQGTKGCPRDPHVPPNPPKDPGVPPQGTQGCPRAPDVPPRAPPDSHGQAAGASRAGARLHAQAGDDPHVLGLVDDCGDVAGGSQLCPFKATPPRATPPVSPCHPPISTPMSPKMRPHTPRPSRATQGMGAESCVFPQCHPGGGSSPVCVPPITQGVSTALSPPQCHPEGGCSPVSRPPPSPRGRLQPCVSPPPSPSGWVQS